MSLTKLKNAIKMNPSNPSQFPEEKTANSAARCAPSKPSAKMK